MTMGIIESHASRRGMMSSLDPGEQRGRHVEQRDDDDDFAGDAKAVAPEEANFRTALRGTRPRAPGNAGRVSRP